MSYPPKIPLLGEQDEDSEWIPSAKKEWVPPVKKPKRWGTNLPQPRKQWQRKFNNRKGGKK